MVTVIIFFYLVLFFLYDQNLCYCHLGIQSSGNLPLQKAPPLYEGVGSISGIFKIYVCVSLD
jgi:hypothetical protein